MNEANNLQTPTQPPLVIADVSRCPSINFFNVDCIEFMKSKPDKCYQWGFIDPPYGLGDRLSDGGGKLKNTPMATLYRESSKWDILPNAEFWKEFFRVTENQVVFGANYFLEYLPNTRAFVCWDKKQDMPTLSACELIWTSLDKPAKIARYSSMDLNRFHPTQKPVDIYRFMFKYCKIEENATLLDCFGGSGNIAIACDKEKLNLDICEIDETYYQKSKLSYETFKRQMRLF